MSNRYKSLRAIAQYLPGGMSAGRFFRRNFEPGMREIVRLQRLHGTALLQSSPFTVEERYPALFDAVAGHLAGLSAPRILSFGCSSGAEVRAMRRRLPHAQIVGLDPNRRMIAAARALDPHPHTEYRIATTPKGDDQFDAILALAVLRNGLLQTEQPENCEAIMPFARFAGAVAALDACLVGGGWLAIWHAHFRFMDAPVAEQYRVDPLRIGNQKRADPKWGPDNRRLPPSRDTPVLFRKAENGFRKSDR
jgi:hypothetical protein